MVVAVKKPPSASPSRTRARRRNYLAIASYALGLAMLLALAVGVAWLPSEAALRRLIDFAIAQSDGRIRVEEASGSLLGSLKLARISYRDAGTSFVAEDVTIDFQPRNLIAGRLVVSELRVKHVVLEFATGNTEPIALPDSVALPIDLVIERLHIDRVDWRLGGTSGALAGLTLAYSSDKSTHRLRDLDVAAPGLKLSGTASLRTRPPFAITGSLSLALSKPLPEGRVQATLSGDLEALQVQLDSGVGGLPANARAKFTPFARAWLVEGRLEARDLDLSRADPAWPVTRLELTIDVLPAPGGLAGRAKLVNAIAGPLDAKRLPLEQAQSSFTFSGTALAFNGLTARAAGGGAIEGGGTVNIDSRDSRWKVAVRGLDLAQIHTALASTRLDGRIDAEANARAQRIVADVSQRDLHLAFDAGFDGETLVADRMLVRGYGGLLEGSGRIAIAGARPFTAKLSAQRFDPARFGNFPAGTLDGTLLATGTLAPEPAADVQLVVAPGSRLAGLAANGKLRGRFTPSAVQALDADLTVGANRLQAWGAYGRSGDKLAVKVAARRLAELVPLLPTELPRPFAGALDAMATIENLGRDSKFAIDARGTRVELGKWQFATIAAQGQLAHPAPFEQLHFDALRDVALEVEATGVIAPAGRATRARATLTGNADAHWLTFAANDGELSLEGRLNGTLAAASPPIRWRGRIESLASRGLPGFDATALRAPAALELGDGHVVLGAARLEGAGVTLDIDGASWRQGALETRGRLTGLSLAPLIKRAGLEARFSTDMSVGGAWMLGSQPDWHGSLEIARERGDVYIDDPSIEGAQRIALGLETVVLKAALDRSRLSGTAELRATLGGDALADFELSAPSGSNHPFSAEAPLRASIRAHLPSLATLQPWVGTAMRLQGQAIGDVAVAGTLESPALSGQLVGYGLRVDMPQYGVSYRDGQLRIASGPEGLKLEELSFKAGDGRFIAAGLIGLPRVGASAPAPSRIEWKVENFRALNRPDRRLIVDGEGTLGFEAKRLLLRGKLAADEGNIDYRSEADTTLADDIVVVGRPRPGRIRSDSALASEVPLDLDLTLELGRNLRFTTEGLDARLAGRVQVTSKGGGPVIGRGVIRAERGTYWAFGQRLTIERGRVIFDGPLANPSLDVVALRKNLAVEAGVEITGTARAPLIRLTSSPLVPDAEKLAWLLTGGPSGSGTARESAALQAASAALLGTGGKPVTQQIAHNIGLDDISVAQRETTTTTATPLSGQVVTLGKRITDNLYVAYEQGLTIATNALRIEYVLTRALTVSAFAGTTSGVALNFRRSWR